MSLEYITKILVALVVVVTGFTTNYYVKIKKELRDTFIDNTPASDFPKPIEQQSFTAKEIAGYISNCYKQMTSLPEDEQRDTVCYILNSPNGFNLTNEDVKKYLQSDLSSQLEIQFDQKNDILVIGFKEAGEDVYLEGSGDVTTQTIECSNINPCPQNLFCAIDIQNQRSKSKK